MESFFPFLENNGDLIKRYFKYIPYSGLGSIGGYIIYYFLKTKLFKKAISEDIGKVQIRKILRKLISKLLVILCSGFDENEINLPQTMKDISKEDLETTLCTLVGDKYETFLEGFTLTKMVERMIEAYKIQFAGSSYTMNDFLTNKKNCGNFHSYF